MFTAITVYKIVAGQLPDVASMRERMVAFAPCLQTQEKSVGWVPPRGDGEALVEAVGRHLIAKFCVETKRVPASEIAKRVKEAKAKIEEATGRKPGKKETKELRDDAFMALLPQAFPRQKQTPVWFDLDKGRILVGSTSSGDLDEIVTALVRSFDGVAIANVSTNATPQSAMTRWLSSEDDAEELYVENGLSIGRLCELRSADEEKSVVRFKNHNLDNDEVRKHVAEGKLPVKLAMSYEDRVVFELDDNMGIKKIAFLDVVFENSDREDRGIFEADVALATGELQPLIDNLIGACDGEVVAT